MRESQQSASMWTDEEPSRQGSNTELVAYLEAENSMLRGRALKLASEIRALREALGGDVPSENTPDRRRADARGAAVAG